ncbi:MAG: hypothetical protein ACR2N4_04895 [Jatrophihabitans sp.]
MASGARQPVVVRLPTELVTRYRAVDREYIGAPMEVVDTPRHLDALTEDIRRRGILVPLELWFNDDFGALDGNHRIAVAIRLGLDEVPVELVEKPTNPRPGHAQPMHPRDLLVIRNARATSALAKLSDSP